MGTLVRKSTLLIVCASLAAACGAPTASQPTAVSTPTPTAAEQAPREASTPTPTPTKNDLSAADSVLQSTPTPIVATPTPVEVPSSADDEPTDTPAPPTTPTATATLSGPTATPTPTPIIDTRPVADEAALDQSEQEDVPFVVLDDPPFIAASEASFMEDDELVLGLDVEGEQRAYPVSMMWFHHIINDTVRGRPITVTY